MSVPRYLLGGTEAADPLEGPADLFRAVFDTSPVASFVVDEASLGVVIVNDAALALYGYPRAGFLALRVTDLLADSDWQLSWATTSRGELRDLDTVHRDARGALMDVRVSAYRLMFPGRAVWNVQVQDRSTSVAEMRVSLGATVTAMERAVRARDPYTANHQRRVAHLCVTIAEELSLEPDLVLGLRTAAELHDIGKIGLPSEILNFPGPLSAPAAALVRTHPQVGHDMIETIPFRWPVARIVLEHHERLDGSGYPHGLVGSSILLESRILAVADVAEAMTAHRPYRPALSVEAALAELSDGSGELYEPDVVGVCTRLLTSGEFEFPGLALG